MGWLPGSGCALWLQMDERQGNTAYDLSGNNNHGTIYGATWGRGKIGYCLSFDGVDDYVNCGADPSLNITDKLTVELWVKHDTVELQQMYLARWGESWYFQNLLGRRLELALIGATTAYRRTPYYLTELGWHHIVGVYDGTVPEARIYYDAKRVDSDAESAGIIPPSLNPTTRPLLIGNYQNNLWMDGLIDEVRIYNRVLSVKEIEAHYWYGIIPAVRPPQGRGLSHGSLSPHR